MPDHVLIYTDGGSRGNPGPAAAGFCIRDPHGRQLLAKGLFLGETTNNVAEYTALLRAVEAAVELGAASVEAFSDSELMVRQINGRYKVKSPLIKPLFKEVRGLLERLDSWSLRHIAREKNTAADSLVNKALDLGRDVQMKPDRARAAGKAARLAVLISGGGTTLINILEHIKRGDLHAAVPLVISSRSTVKGVERARNAGLQVEIIRRKDYPDVDSFSEALKQRLDDNDIDLVVQGGWLCLWRIPRQYNNRVMNIHPALLPSFGGQGMWGHHVHQAVLDAGCKVSGCTVHFCTNEYDGGPIIVQRTCPVKEGDTADSLAERVFEQECIAYPEAIRLFAENRLVIRDGHVEIKS